MENEMETTMLPSILHVELQSPNNVCGLEGSGPSGYL